MTLQAIQSGPVFPSLLFGPRTGVTVAHTALSALDATSDRIAFMGHVMWDGAPGSAKTMSSAGAKIHLKTGTVTFANAGTTVRFGVQDCITASGAGLAPVDVHDVYGDLVGGGGGIVSDSTLTVSMGAGSKSIAHGQLVAIVCDMTARAGSDSVVFEGLNGGGAWRPPGLSVYTGSWVGTGSGMPNVLIEADDGTFGILAGCPYLASIGVTAFSDSTTPDERALIFQVPFRCKAAGAWVYLGSNNSAADATLSLYETPLATPNALTTVSILGEQGNANTSTLRPRFYPWVEQTLEPGVDYAIALRATGASPISVSHATVAAAHRAVMGMANCRLGTRNNDSGAFSETTTEIPIFALQISALDDGAAGGGGSGGGPLIGSRIVQ